MLRGKFPVGKIDGSVPRVLVQDRVLDVACDLGRVFVREETQCEPLYMPRTQERFELSWKQIRATGLFPDATEHPGRAAIDAIFAVVVTEQKRNSAGPSV